MTSLKQQEPKKQLPKEQHDRAQKSAKKPMTKAEQRRRFEEMSRELGCDEGQALDAEFSKIVPPRRATKAKG